MKAVVQYRYGEAEEVLRLEEVDQPTAGDDEVLLRVCAAGVDRAVWQGLRDKGKVTSGQKVLVIGASGGVGTFAVQIAKA